MGSCCNQHLHGSIKSTEKTIYLHGKYFLFIKINFLKISSITHLERSGKTATFVLRYYFDGIIIIIIIIIVIYSHSVDPNLITKTMDMEIVKNKVKIFAYIIHRVTNTYNCN
jgi:hypothetical protein